MVLANIAVFYQCAGLTAQILRVLPVNIRLGAAPNQLLPSASNHFRDEKKQRLSRCFLEQRKAY
jgi:hypothetical protein